MSLLIVSNSYSQSYAKTLDSLIKNYRFEKEGERRPMAIQNKLINENINRAFNYVILSNSDLISNSSAFGISKNQENTQVSSNANVRISNQYSLYPSYLKVGANVSGSGNFFDFYSKNSWKDNTNLNIGLIGLIPKVPASVFFQGTKGKFDLLNKKRRLFASEPILNLEKYTLDTLNVDKLLKKIETRVDIIDSDKDILKDFPSVRNSLKQNKILEAYSKLELERQKIAKYQKALHSDSTLCNYIKNEILYTFDKKNDITYGYHLLWFDVNFGIGNGTYKFKKEEISELVYDIIKDTLSKSNSLNKLNLKGSANLNYSRNDNNKILYAQIGFSISNSSYLDNNLISGKPKIQLLDEELILYDESEQILGNFNTIKEDFVTSTTHAYFAGFFWQEKKLGLNISLRYNGLIKKVPYVYYINNFSTLIGPVFRIVKDDQTSSTFSVDIGWENAQINEGFTKDSFTARIRVGLPFNVYKKKKPQ